MSFVAVGVRDGTPVVSLAGITVGRRGVSTSVAYPTQDSAPFALPFEAPGAVLTAPLDDQRPADLMHSLRERSTPADVAGGCAGRHDDERAVRPLAVSAIGAPW